MLFAVLKNWKLFWPFNRHPDYLGPIILSMFDSFPRQKSLTRSASQKRTQKNPLLDSGSKSDHNQNLR